MFTSVDNTQFQEEKETFCALITKMQKLCFEQWQDIPSHYNYFSNSRVKERMAISVTISLCLSRQKISICL
jgi:hypothetical protein